MKSDFLHLFLDSFIFVDIFDQIKKSNLLSLVISLKFQNEVTATSEGDEFIVEM